MTEPNLAGAPPIRRVSVVARTLRPLQREIGLLQDRLAFLTAKKMFALRQNDCPEIDADLGECSSLIMRLRDEFSVAVKTLPAKALADTRLADTRLALDRAERAILSLAGQIS
jgi:hypothetical protein